MNVEEIYLNGCFVITPQIFRDDRGFFYETFNQNDFCKQTGIKTNFVQDNLSKSSKGVLRGLHFQQGEHAQAKLVHVLKGSVLDVCVDLRQNSSTFGKHYTIHLDAVDKIQFYIPRGFAHGFVALEDDTLFAYKCDNFYDKSSERGIQFDDEFLNIDWKLSGKELIISKKDKGLPTFDKLFK